MSQSFNYEAEPFQGFTEFDEFESSDEFDEFGEPEFGDFEIFESDFEFEPEEERGRAPRAAGGRAAARGGGPARGMGARAPGRRAPGRPGRPGMRQARGMRGPGGMRRAGPRGPGAMRGRAGMRRPGMRRPGMRRPGPGGRPRRRWPYPFPGYPGYVIRQPVEWPIGVGGGPFVGRFGNWKRSGNDVILLLDEDETPLEGAAGASPEGSAPEGAAGGAPSEGAAGAPANGGTPPEDASDASASGSEGELSGRGGLSRSKLGKIQKALNFLMGLRLQPHGLSNPQTRSALRSYQQQKGLVPHGQVDQETETEMAYDLEDSMNEYEMEFGGTGCLSACAAARRSCVASGADPFDCFFAYTDCLIKCPELKGCPPRPTLRRGSKGNRVREAQARLNARGSTPPIAVDGDFGPDTEAATRGFQRSRGLLVDGIIGKDTWNALGC